MTEARDIVEEQTLKECGCCGNMHIMVWSDDYVASLRKQLEDAREALREIRDCTTEHGGAAKALRIINEALKGKS